MSTHMLNGEVLDCSATEDDVQVIAASWNQSRYASRVANAAPIYAQCAATASQCAADTIVSRVDRKPMQSNWSHDDVCMACGDGGQLLLCNLCPAAYHLECIGADQVQHPVPPISLLLCQCPNSRYPPLQIPAGVWKCAHHACCVCEKKSQDCSNCLFRHRPPPPPTVIACSSSPRARSRPLHSETTVPLDTRADAKIAHARSAKTANLTTCRSCPVMTAALLAG